MDVGQRVYWGSTALFAFALGLSGVADIVLPEPMRDGMVGQLGLPVWFVSVLGVWKLAGVAALLAPGLGRLKEWAYAGFFFDLSGAVVAHLVVLGEVGPSLTPLLLLGLGGLSYVYRPASRTLGEPWAQVATA